MSGIREETCVCIGEEWTPLATFKASSLAEAHLTSTVGATQECQQRYTGSVFGIQAKTLIDSLHFLSAGAVSFARGLNDTPKIAALLLVAKAIKPQWSIVIVGIAIALGGLLN
ncbi:MAG: inorganic phosphate transporter, partial [Akkermansiaceae bacterium]|nr:inorganic phosphate transporter [Akkermansiaceae bacterium]